MSIEREKVVDLQKKLFKYLDANLVTNLEQTKSYLVSPMIKLLGYDATNPFEVRVNYSCDSNDFSVDVDYCIFDNANNIIIYILIVILMVLLQVVRLLKI